jgi:hypothetical protein
VKEPKKYSTTLGTKLITVTVVIFQAFNLWMPKREGVCFLKAKKMADFSK